MSKAIDAHPSFIPQEQGVSGVALYGLFAAGAVSLLLSASSLSVAYNTIAGYTWAREDHALGLAQIDQDSETSKALFEAYAQQGEGVHLKGYKCDPMLWPDFEARPWAKEGRNVPVDSEDGYTVGRVTPEGRYEHFGYCEKP